MTDPNVESVAPETSAAARHAMSADDDTVAVARGPRRPAPRSTSKALPGAADDAADAQGDDRTIVVAKRAKATRATATPLAPPAPRTPRRRGIAPPPGPVVIAPQALESVGASATETYRPRAMPVPPLPAAPVPDGPAATRDASASLPSVARHTRITARTALVAFCLACAVSVIGLTLIALAYLRTR